MLVLPMHLHAVNFLGRNKISGVILTITECLLKGAGGLAVRSKRGDISVAIGITTGYHLTIAFCSRLLFSWMQNSGTGVCGPFSMAWHVRSPCTQYSPT